MSRPRLSIAATRPQANAGRTLQRAWWVLLHRAPRFARSSRGSALPDDQRQSWRRSGASTIPAPGRVAAVAFVSEEGAAFACWICAGRRTSAALGAGRSTGLVEIFVKMARRPKDLEKTGGPAAMPIVKEKGLRSLLHRATSILAGFRPRALAPWRSSRCVTWAPRDSSRSPIWDNPWLVPERVPRNPGSSPSQTLTHVDVIMEKRSSAQRRGPVHPMLRDECAETGKCDGSDRDNPLIVIFASKPWQGVGKRSLAAFIAKGLVPAYALACIGPLSLSPSTSCLQQDLRFGDFLLSAGLVREHHPDGFLHLPPTSSPLTNTMPIAEAT
ncbi:hypothetical protein S7711_11325 [Stachybotrys chartarum IBT 7711]|uniref:Uncharacterized protein n=1 Tax=Stachybotrys chartarum (strain CBS 109288 / IBT 7711) TaxID=1280523 RepID=A0A084AHR5_STACB|nr:hypothetical protein S7711_11325 [Stachybotrys chartarum IBT 7711]KFA55866.1 hypothetical protein S40293_10565 [Stachybotrys chartarum IBT 40293]